MDGHENDADPLNQQSVASDNSTPPTSSGNGAIFSSSDTRVETENLPEIQPMPLDAAPAGDITPAIRTESTITDDLRLSGSAPTKKKWPLVFAGVVVVVVVAIIIFVLVGGPSFTNRSKGVAGEMNLDYIFDETAPIPVEQNGRYGYIDYKSGEWIINPQYPVAGNFYGDYAAVGLLQGEEQHTIIINRSGETIVSQENGSVGAYYDIQNNIWVVGGNIYDSSMQKLNADGTTGSYIGNGYIISDVQRESSSPETNGDGTESISSSDTEESSSYNEIVSRIEDLEGNVRYDCQALCVANTTSNENGQVYAIVHSWGGPAMIIGLPSGEVLYTAPNTGQIQVLHNTVFVEDMGTTKKYLKIENNEVSVVNSQAKDVRATISNAGEYYVDECDGLYGVFKTNGEAIMKCDIREYTELSEATYLMYQTTFSKDLLFIERADKLELVNLKNANPLKTFELGEVAVYDNSPFFYLLSNDDAAKVCNLLKGVNKCVNLEDSNADVAGFGNYFTVTSEDSIKIYNANLEIIYE